MLKKNLFKRRGFFVRHPVNLRLKNGVRRIALGLFVKCPALILIRSDEHHTASHWRPAEQF